jgi:hypothetical protein
LLGVGQAAGAGEVVPIAGQETQRLRIELLGRRIPRQPGRGGAVSREGRDDRRDVARGDIRGPACNAVPIERSVGDAPNSLTKCGVLVP